MGWRLYTVTDWCVEKMGPWTGRGAILFPDLARHNHTSPPPPHWQPAKRSPATRSVKSHGAHGAPCPRTCVSGCLYVGCAVRTMVDRPPGQRMWTSCFWAVSGRNGEKTFIALKQWKTSPQWRRGEKSFAPAGEKPCRTGRPVGTDRQRACTAQSAAICSGPRWMPMTLPWMSTSPSV